MSEKWREMRAREHKETRGMVCFSPLGEQVVVQIHTRICLQLPAMSRQLMNRGKLREREHESSAKLRFNPLQSLRRCCCCQIRVCIYQTKTQQTGHYRQQQNHRYCSDNNRPASTASSHLHSSHSHPSLSRSLSSYPLWSKPCQHLPRASTSKIRGENYTKLNSSLERARKGAIPNKEKFSIKLVRSKRRAAKRSERVVSFNRGRRRRAMALERHRCFCCEPAAHCWPWCLQHCP